MKAAAVKLKKCLKSTAGLTLVEVIISLVIIALAALILANAFGGSMKIMQRGTDRMRAADAAYRSMELANEGAATVGGFQAGGAACPVSGFVKSRTEEQNDAEVTYYAFEAIQSGS